MIEIGTLLQDRYLIEKQIGAGGMGAVYRAIDQRFGSYVAIKETFYKDEELGDAFEREAHLLNSLLHPVLPHVSDYFTDDSGHFLVMQFIEGEDLFVTLKREGAFPIQDVIRWTDSLLDALDYLHSQDPPVIHRDIKPQNLKITPRGDIILLDFGLAKLNSSDTMAALSVFGYSRTYSPLEQIQGTGTDARSDIFALGATAYHLLTGKPPIDVLARAAAIVAGNLDPLQLASEINGNVSVAVAIVLKSALALNPAQRFVSAQAMRLALQNALNSDLPANIETAILPIQNNAPVLDNQIISQVVTEDFPALEAFADDVKNLPPNELENNLENNSNAVKILPNIETAVPLIDTSAQTSYAQYPPIEFSGKKKQARFPLAAVAAILIFAGLAVGYFLVKSSSSNDSAETPIISASQESDVKAEKTAADSISYIPESSAAPASEITETNKPAATSKKSSIEKPDAKKSKPEETENSENTENINFEPAPVETVRPNPVQNTRPKTIQRPRKPAPQNNEKQPVPDIESIFTGRPSDRRDENEQGGENIRLQSDEMTEEEWKEMRRQRRKERQRRRNNQPLPF